MFPPLFTGAAAGRRFLVITTDPGAFFRVSAGTGRVSGVPQRLQKRVCSSTAGAPQPGQIDGEGPAPEGSFSPQRLQNVASSSGTMEPQEVQTG